MSRVGRATSLAVQTRPIHAVHQRGELRSAQTHHSIADRRPPERPVLQPLPEQHQSGPVPGQDLQTVRPLRTEDEDRSRERILPQLLAHQRRQDRRRLCGNPPACRHQDPHPAGTAIMSPPSRHAAPWPKLRHRSPVQTEPSRPRSRSQSSGAPQQCPSAPASTITGANVGAPPYLLARMPHMPAPGEQLLGRQSVPPRYCGDRVAARVAFCDDPLLLLRVPRTTAAGSRENLKSPHRLRVRLGQKLSVGHVSNPLDPAGFDIRPISKPCER